MLRQNEFLCTSVLFSSTCGARSSACTCSTRQLYTPGECVQGGAVASGGLRELIPTVARTAVAVGVDGIFMEVPEAHTHSPLSFVVVMHLHIDDWTLPGGSICLPAPLPSEPPSLQCVA